MENHSQLAKNTMENLYRSPLLGSLCLFYSLVFGYFECSNRGKRLFSLLNRIRMTIPLPDKNRAVCRLTDLFPIGEIYMAGTYQEVEKPGYDTVIDIGAGIGIFSLKMSKVMDNAQLIAIEPDPENYAFLKKNALINNLKIKLHPIALSKNHGHSKFFVSSMKILSSINPIKGAREIDVLVSTLDRVLDGQQTGRTLIKIDVEGAELDVLKGAEETMKGEVSLIMEVHPQHVKLQDIETHLQNRGFSTNVRRGVKRSFPHILTAHKINPCQLPVPEGNIKN